MEKYEPLLSVENLQVSFQVRGRELTALRGVDLHMNAGESVAIVGESGSGKSVFTRALTGMLEDNGKITAGSIRFQGQELTALRRERGWQSIRGGGIATVFQDPMMALNPVLTIGKQLTSAIRAHQKCTAKEARERGIEMLRRVGIPNPEKRMEDYPFRYSGGMRQRVVIAIALSCQPKLLICDEPTTALDVTLQAQILALLQELQQELGFGILFITHDLGVVAKMAHRVAVLYAGQIVEQGTVEEIFYDPRHPYTWALLSSLPQLAVGGESLYAIPGTPPSLYGKLTGDAFAPRNPYRLKIDGIKEPPVFSVTPTHTAKTWLLDPRAPKTEKPEAIRELHQKLLDQIREV
ncbi:MAG: ABC transporter ATP-binding protein [Oscillospiraceae bacterium]|nr:ABC transporter ATP-binding protein [Oscillospiraceae bacterium]